MLVADNNVFTPTAYQEGYMSKVGDSNPYPVGIRRGDWNEGFMDMRAGRDPKEGGHYGLPIPRELRQRANSSLH